MARAAEDLLRRCQRGVELALAAGADSAELYANAESVQEAAWQKNDLDQVRSSSETTYGLRVLVDGRPGFATSNLEGELPLLARAAVDLARTCPQDPTLRLPDPAALSGPTQHLDARLLEVGALELVTLGEALLRDLVDREPRLTIDTAALRAIERVDAIASSTGVAATFHTTEATGEIFGMARGDEEVGSVSFDGDTVGSWAALEPALAIAFARFSKNAVGALGATPGESFRGPMLLPPEVVGSLLMAPLLGALCADTVRQGRSPFASRIGQRIASPLLHLADVGAGFPGLPLSRFDREGQPRRATTLIDAGVLQTFFTDSREARLAGLPATGSATGDAKAPPRVGPGAVGLRAGSHPVAELQRMDHGIIVTRYSGTTNPVTGDFSGVVKGGFLVRGGEARPIRETTIAGKLWECLNRISAVSQERTIFHGIRAWPSIRVEDVAVTAG